jgi:hypothetical protein
MGRLSQSDCDSSHRKCCHRIPEVILHEVIPVRPRELCGFETRLLDGINFRIGMLASISEEAFLRNYRVSERAVGSSLSLIDGQY